MKTLDHRDVRYVIITPVRDEQQYLRSTIENVMAQTILPVEWVIVNDGSTDGTGDIIDDYAGRVPWIHAVHRSNRGFRKSGGGVVEAFNDGYNALRCPDWDFIVKLDGDLTFAPDYFGRCFEHFRNEPRLGIGGGDIYHDICGDLKREVNPRFHVRGATKIYKRDCWKAIVKLWQGPGWDTIDEVKANMLGWNTQSFPELRLLHHRITGSADGWWRDGVKHGLVCYISGYHPIFVAASCLYRLTRRPYILRSFSICFGFFKGYLTRVQRVNDTRLITYIRSQQLNRIYGRETIWK
jgi:biofilm PGA synthesis N-glycosyltransferase PgaC